MACGSPRLDLRPGPISNLLRPAHGGGQLAGNTAMTDRPTRQQVVLAQVVWALMILFVLAGAAWYGLSGEVLMRIWHNLVERPGGPMTFRFILQPVMATVAAALAGARDARAGRSPYFWSIVSDPRQRGPRLQEGMVATARIVLLGLVMDVVYQLLVFDTFHPAEAALVALLLAFVPYLLLRGPIARIAAWWFSRQSAGPIR